MSGRGMRSARRTAPSSQSSTTDSAGPPARRPRRALQPAWSIPTRPVFEVAGDQLSWLNTGFFVGELRQAGPGRVTIAVHEVVPA